MHATSVYTHVCKFATLVAFFAKFEVKNNIYVVVQRLNTEKLANTTIAQNFDGGKV